MKKLYYLITLLFMAGGISAQTDVYLQVDHRLGTAPFQFNTPAANNNNVAFNVSRLQYYISQITLIHDGGQQTLVPNTWILVDAGTPVNQFLGSFTFTTLEGIRLGIGVESAVNHLDPSSYAANHPLAPKNPSMHWGWSAGYRFVAMEGKSGNNFSQTYEIHALEDVNYFQTTVNTAGVVTTNGHVVVLNADYEMALKDIDVSNGPITHGGFGEAITLLQNFRDDVFSASTTVSLEDGLSHAGDDFILYPNPSTASGKVNISAGLSEDGLISVTDLTGRIVAETPATSSVMTLDIGMPGYYLVSYFKEGKKVATRKLIITE